MSSLTNIEANHPPQLDKSNAVFYTDGSFKKDAGAGIHGYFYKKKNEMSNKVATVKGYHVENATKVEVLSYLDAVYPCKGGTNNTAELQAIIEALYISISANLKKVIIYSDSDYSIKSITLWGKSWMKNGWKKNDGSVPKNSKIIAEAMDLMARLKESGCVVKLMYIKAHNGFYGNERADDLAKKASDLAEKNIIDPVITYYEEHPELLYPEQTPKEITKLKPETSNPLLFKTFVYTNLYASEEDKYVDGLGYVYHQGRHVSKKKGKKGQKARSQAEKNDLLDYFIGKSSSHHSYAVAIIDKPNPYITAIQNRMKVLREAGSIYTNDIMVIALQYVLNKTIAAHLDDEGKVLGYIPDGCASLNTYTDMEIARLVTPPRRAWSMIDTVSMLESMLLLFISYMDKEKREVQTNQFIRSKDITGEIYETLESKNKSVCKCKLSVGWSSMIVNLPLPHMPNGKKVHLVADMDIPSRNAMNKLVKLNPKVWLVNWDLPSGDICYGTIIVTDTGYLLSSSVHAATIVP